MVINPFTYFPIVILLGPAHGPPENKLFGIFESFGSFSLRLGDLDWLKYIPFCSFDVQKLHKGYVSLLDKLFKYWS